MENSLQAPGAGPEEQDILDEIYRRTGLSFKRLGGIDAHDQDQTSVVLPILRERRDEISDESLRCVVYSLFCTRNARSWIEDIISWWETEKDSDALSLLSVALAKTVDKKYATRIWSLAKQLPERPNHYLLLASLARFGSVADEVIEHILSNRARLTPGDIDDVSRIKDKRIKEWLSERKSLGLEGLRANGDVSLSFSLELSRNPPDRSREAGSVEVSLRSLENTIVEWFRSAGLPPPAVSGLALKAVDLEIDRWVELRFAQGVAGRPGIWLRLEDVDTVEIVFVKDDHMGQDGDRPRRGRSPL